MAAKITWKTGMSALFDNHCPNSVKAVSSLLHFMVCHDLSLAAYKIQHLFVLRSHFLLVVFPKQHVILMYFFPSRII